ncbi:popeye domain-containing protein [Halomonas sp. ANAO-440]|nr:popeye domain-containing protein [Halomonas sp. ANAO-440]MBZ0331777.1 popeye domain-containing protein [Halomonas sp. ANAO-440]
MHTVALFFFANVLFCLAYMVRDMAYLRAITILAACSTLPYFYFQAVPLYSAMGWQVAFIVINSFNLIVLLLHRRPIKLNEQEQWLHESTLRFLKPRKMRRLLRLAKTHDRKKGEVLIMKDQELNALLLILSGRARVEANGQQRAMLYPGDFVGEMSFVSRKPTSADVIAEEPLRYLVWEAETLEQLYVRDPEMKDALQSAIGMDMANKLAR